MLPVIATVTEAMHRLGLGFVLGLGILLRIGSKVFRQSFASDTIQFAKIAILLPVA